MSARRTRCVACTQHRNWGKLQGRGGSGRGGDMVKARGRGRGRGRDSGKGSISVGLRLSFPEPGPKLRPESAAPPTRDAPTGSPRGGLWGKTKPAVPARCAGV